MILCLPQRRYMHIIFRTDADHACPDIAQTPSPDNHVAEKPSHLLMARMHFSKIILPLLRTTLSLLRLLLVQFKVILSNITRLLP